MGYITITPPLFSLAPYGVNIFFFFGGFISIKSVISRFLLNFLCSGAVCRIRNLERVEHNIHWVFLLRIVIDNIRISFPYLVQMPFTGEPGFLGYVYHVSNLFDPCTCHPVGLVALKHAEEILNRFQVTLYVQVLIGLVSVCKTLT